MNDQEICITALETWPVEARPGCLRRGDHGWRQLIDCGVEMAPMEAHAIDLFIASGLKWLLTQHADVMLFHKADWYKSSTPMFVSGACPTFLSAIHSAITSQGIDAGKGGGA